MQHMSAAHFSLLQEFSNTPSPSGFEQPLQRVIRRELEACADSVETDVMGNVIACKRSTSVSSDAQRPMRIMLAGHCDEIGFMVHYIDEKGFLFFAPIGGVDAHMVPGQRVYVHSANGPVLGVVGKKPIHQIDPKDRDTVIKFKAQFIDIGAKDGEHAAELVRIGDPVTFVHGMERLQGQLATSRAFDDKMGAFIVTRVMQEVSKRGGHEVDLYSVTTVQEELGLRGAISSTYGVNPTAGIAVDVDFASDFPGQDKSEVGDFVLGKGPIVSRGANINPVLFELICATAREKQIPIQISAQARATGTDANAMQLSRGGVAAALLGVPLRYMHSPVEVLSLDDIEAAIELLTAVVLRIDPSISFIPK
ncbi:MAG: M42 family metallopeptidase [Desulfuromonadaceae bacterium]|nr:M42 family metallopeptidase [Desulfuromonadaceae bacterium]